MWASIELSYKMHMFLDARRRPLYQTIDNGIRWRKKGMDEEIFKDKPYRYGQNKTKMELYE
jgi:hypothetical protein